MSEQHLSTVSTTSDDVEPVEDDTTWVEPAVALRPSPSRRASLYQRGMVTAEYAVGILAAIALALVLMKVFNDRQVFTVLLQQVTRLIGHMSASIK